MKPFRSSCVLFTVALALAACNCVAADAPEPAATVQPVCAPGLRDCPCETDGRCDVHLSCDEGTCRETRGFAGAGCFANETCDPGYLCEDDTCVICTPGSPGCACDAEARCEGSLACTNGRCLNASLTLLVARRPADPVCYTPCTDDWFDDSGEPHVCTKGLMVGCLNGFQCNDGSCVPSATPLPDPPACAGDVDCTDYQVCVTAGNGAPGRCYSNCDAAADCDAGMVCSNHACRQPCDSSASTCVHGQECKLLDEAHGVCMPVRARDPGPPVGRANGAYTVTEEPLGFSNIDITKTVTIHNLSDRALDFYVRKRQQRTDGRPGDATAPLPWLRLAAGAGAASDAIELPAVRIEADHDAVITVSVVSGVTMPASWDGLLEIEQKDLGIRRVAMSYTQKLDSRFAGEVHYFASFSDVNLEAWRNRRTSTSLLWNVRNAFVQKWGAFRTGGVASVDELDALITATVSGSWDWPNTRSACTGGAACYLFADGSALDRAGVRTYTTDLVGYPIPTGATSLPIALDLQLTGPRQLAGRIASEKSLQYPGSPAITLDFDSDVASCLAGRQNACVSTIKRMNATISIGARQPTPAEGCSSSQGLSAASTPWLLNDFTVGTSADAQTNARYLQECRDNQQPFPGSVANAAALNRALAGANPIPDGQVRRRRLELIDGYLVDKDRLYLLFRETFEPGFLGAGGPSFSVYGLMTLRRTVAQLPADAFVGYAQADARAMGRDPSADLQCNAEILGKVLGPGAIVTAGNADQLASGLISGISHGATPPQTYSDDLVHYLCDIGTFDGPCPAGHDVDYFVGDGLTGSLAGDSCNAARACADRLQEWKNSKHVRERVIYRCDDQGAYCDADRQQLKSHKVFFMESPAVTVLLPLRAEVDHAFRYATQFRSQDGQTRVGFKPAVCESQAHTTVPYCYDPAEIERTQARVDCLLDTLHRFPDSLSETTEADAEAYLSDDFAYHEETRSGLPPLRHDGFERLYAELLIMLGDDAYTSSFRSRFDIAGMLGGDFEGSKFEVGGQNASGGLGLELRTLYQSTQYYQLALDRYYRLAPGIWRSLAQSGPQFVTQRTVTSYFAHVLRASTQKAQAYGQIARRYQILQRPALARQVVERAYAATYLESLTFGRMMRNLIEQASPEDVAQIQLELTRASASYGHALLQMRQQYDGITDTVRMFGYAPDYVPLPVVGHELNIFEKEYNEASTALVAATQAEDAAIVDHQSFESSSQGFQTALTQLRTSYETRLRAICGTMTGTDGVVYPAIARYASQNTRASVLGDPCGLMDGGLLRGAMHKIDDARVSTLQVAQGYTKVKARIDSELTRIDELCGHDGVITRYADVVFNDAVGQHKFEDKMNKAKQHIDGIVRNTDNIRKGLDFLFCNKGTSSDCEKMALSAAWAITIFTTEAAIGSLQSEIDDASRDLADLQANAARAKVNNECDVAKVNSNATLRDLALEYADLDLQALKADYQMRVEVEGLVNLREEATATEAEQEEAEQLRIRDEAARNDPNTRLYSNDAVQRADETFNDAITKAYLATKVFEYYTGQSYADIDSLLTIRMVKRGQPNLTSYMTQLHNAYLNFGDHTGEAPSGVMIISLMNDVLHIPRIGANKVALPESERQRLFRLALAAPELINRDGLLELPFTTTLRRIPDTADMAKIEHIEVEISGLQTGDDVGHMRLVQQGTSTLMRLDGQKWYLRMDARQALANIFFGGHRTFNVSNPDFYKNRQLTNLPVVNSDWKLIFDQRQDVDNQDIDLRTLTDVKLYVFYNFFSPPPTAH